MQDFSKGNEATLLQLEPSFEENTNSDNLISFSLTIRL